jgi:hypothetical protein
MQSFINQTIVILLGRVCTYFLLKYAQTHNMQLYVLCNYIPTHNIYAVIMIKHISYIYLWYNVYLYALTYKQTFLIWYEISTLIFITVDHLLLALPPAAPRLPAFSDLESLGFLVLGFLLKWRVQDSVIKGVTIFAMWPWAISLFSGKNQIPRCELNKGCEQPLQGKL